MPDIEAYGYPAIGRCIYCGTTEGPLTKEHIIARAIGGNVTLAAASCAPPHGVKSKRRPKTCSEITRDIEQFCFRNMLGHFRHRVGFPSSQRLNELPLTIIHPNKKMEVKDVAVADHVAMFSVPTFEAPGILTGHKGTDSCGSWSYVSNPEVVKQFPEGARVGVVQFHARTYARMLAKIVHAFAVADAGLHAFQPLLPDFILDKSDVPADFLIGCVAKDLPPEDMLHRVHLETAELGDGRRYLVANIRLFAKFGAPQYHVVVGDLPQGAQCG
jgi:hypothetical protein